VVVIKKARDRDVDSRFTAPLPRASCSFERIYFSRGNDATSTASARRSAAARAADLKVHQRRLGNTVFSFIPNTPRSPSTA
jgi:amidophosphoribosyltransferase